MVGLRRVWSTINPAAVATCSEAHIRFLIEDAQKDIASLVDQQEKLVKALKRIEAAPASFDVLFEIRGVAAAALREAGHD
jgi:hypothetical protein